MGVEKIWGFKGGGKTIEGKVEQVEKEEEDEREFREAREALEIVLGRKDEYWKVKSRSNWLYYGDRNKSYYHHQVSQRKEKNHVSSLETVDGRVMTKGEEMDEHIVDFLSESIFLRLDGF